MISILTLLYDVWTKSKTVDANANDVRVYKAVEMALPIAVELVFDTKKLNKAMKC